MLKIGFIGGGKIAQAMANGFIASGQLQFKLYEVFKDIYLYVNNQVCDAIHVHMFEFPIFGWFDCLL